MTGFSEVFLHHFLLPSFGIGDGHSIHLEQDTPSSPAPQPPKSPFPRDQSFQGPWFSQQLYLSSTLGVLAFLTFCAIRRQNTALFAPRTKLKGFSPHAERLDEGIFGWILPTVRAEELKILQIVGLDAAVLLSFLKMGFWLFFFLSIWSCVVLMPVNWIQNGSVDGVSPAEDHHRQSPNGTLLAELGKPNRPLPQLPYPNPAPGTSLYHTTHLVSTYLFTILTLRALWKGYHKFVRSRQLYALELLKSIPARTVEVRNLPAHLRDDQALAEYFEGMDMAVESTAVVRKTPGLSKLLTERANALYRLEKMWVRWLGNPTFAEGYDPEKIMTLASGSFEDEASHSSLTQAADRPIEGGNGGAPVLPTIRSSYFNVSGADSVRMDKPRPKMRLNAWNPFSPKVDALEELTRRFTVLDKAVRERRKAGNFPGGSVGFVTFQDAADAQIAAQTVHYPIAAYCATSLAHEPRDIVWSNVALSSSERRVRQVLVSAFIFSLLLFYIPPLTFLASFLSPEAISKYLPWLWRLLDKDERLRALVQNNLPGIVLIAFNALLPFVFEWSAYLQGLKARSLVEYSVLKKYYLFLVVSVVFIFLIASTAWGVLADLAENPMRLIDKLAQSLPGARHFSLSYVILQALALQPIQLLQLPIFIIRGFWRMFFTRTPREHAELNAPPTLVMGYVYPQALLIFTLGILYSIVSPLICIFGCIYFGVAYVVNKYKLLYVFYKSYESQGQAWPISATRCIWALVLFQLFQLSLFSVRKQLLMSSLMLPLLVFTMWFGHNLSKTFSPLCEHVNLSSIIEVNKGMEMEDGDASAQIGPDGEGEEGGKGGDLAQASGSGSQTPKAETSVKANALLALRAGTPVDPKQSDLARRRYMDQDETLFVAQRDTKTDYREPPAKDYYPGVLNTGRRRYGHPAITGILPELWLPVRVEEEGGSDGENEEDSGGASRFSQVDLEVGLGRQKPTPDQRGGSRARSSSKNDPLILSLRKKRSATFKRPPIQTENIGAVFSPEQVKSQILSDGVSGPQGASGKAALGEVLSGDVAVAPVRSALEGMTADGNEADQAKKTGAVQCEAESSSKNKRRHPNGKAKEEGGVRTEERGEETTKVGRGTEETGEDYDSEECEGVYMHRSHSTALTRSKSKIGNVRTLSLLASPSMRIIWDAREDEGDGDEAGVSGKKRRGLDWLIKRRK
ncbi:DUF221-domain-containing protein [Violaceomyces palustris]|uniref:DUF221-domain-containing protein n=1 Tax=Violaceomyces palustris TaxID=1673888 RepID=A0ACD0NT55_9BASI|nr:DUF221-domain-containing protein [Violaceomyces palustris]